MINTKLPKNATNGSGKDNDTPRETNGVPKSDEETLIGSKQARKHDGDRTPNSKINGTKDSGNGRNQVRETNRVSKSDREPHIGSKQAKSIMETELSTQK